MEIDITNVEEVKEMISKLIYFAYNFEDVEKDINEKIYTEEGKQLDYLHELELGNLNGIELIKVAKKLKEVRQVRRIYKNKLEFIKTLKSFVDKLFTKGIYADSRKLLENIDRLILNQENKQYTPKVIMDLKCAKKKKEANDE